MEDSQGGAAVKCGVSKKAPTPQAQQHYFLHHFTGRILVFNRILWLVGIQHIFQG